MWLIRVKAKNKIYLMTLVKLVRKTGVLVSLG